MFKCLGQLSSHVKKLLRISLQINSTFQLENLATMTNKSNERSKIICAYCALLFTLGLSALFIKKRINVAQNVLTFLVRPSTHAGPFPCRGLGSPGCGRSRGCNATVPWSSWICLCLSCVPWF